MEATKALERDWSSLLPEMLNLIAKNLSKISDFVRFRAVCTTWRFSTPITDLPPQFPWILEDRRSCQDKAYLRFYSIPNKEIHTIHAPKFLDKTVYGSIFIQGYIFAFPRYNKSQRTNTRQFSLLNPLNNDEIHFPVFEFGSGPYWFGHQKNQKGEYVICCGLTSYLDDKLKLVFCCLGQENWCGSLHLDSYMEKHVHFYLKSMFFIVDITTGVTKVINITTGTLAYVIPTVEGQHLARGTVYIVEASGDILRVFKHYNKINIAGFDEFKFLFDVHRLDVNESGSPYWVKVENISDHALFIDYNGAVVLKANYLAGIKANCIYLLKTIYEGIPKRPLCEVERIHIETGAREHLPCPLKSPRGWFFPYLHHLIRAQFI